MSDDLLLKFNEDYWAPGGIERALAHICLPEGGVAIDIGAHVGGFTSLFSYWAGPQGMIYAFEPVEEYFRILKMLPMIVNYQAPIRVCQLALSNHDHPVMIYPPQNNFCNAIANLGSGGVKGTPINAKTLDTVFHSVSRPIDLIKIDVEGGEGLVFEGGQQLLRNTQAVIFECSPSVAKRYGGWTAQQSFTFLRSLGFQLLSLEHQNRSLLKLDSKRDEEFLSMTEQFKMILAIKSLEQIQPYVDARIFWIQEAP